MSDQSMHDLTGWQRVPCEISDLLIASEDTTILAGRTDLDAPEGVHKFQRVWGVGDMLVLLDYIDGRESMHCEHYVPVWRDGGDEA